MGCCGCSLAATVVVAVVFGLVESIFGILWNTLVIVVVETDLVGNGNRSNFSRAALDLDLDPTLDTDIEKELVLGAGNYTGSEEDTWMFLKDTLTHDDTFRKEYLFEIVITALVLNVFWLLASLALAVGHAERSRDMLKPWIAVTVITTATDAAATVYFIFRAVKKLDDYEDHFDAYELFFGNIYVFFACLFSRGGVIIWAINIALCVYIVQRIKQLKYLKHKRTLLDGEFHITPYTLNGPYTYENHNFTEMPKPARPSTPPPDYEGPNGKMRRFSFPSSCETTTLPISLASSREGTKRPVSYHNYLYDDKVEMQHRASCAAETVVHHNYENKGLVLESEEWMGIPRPTLKSSNKK